MSTVKLAKALKIKSRIARDIVDLSRVVREHNCVLVGTTRPMDITKAYEDLLMKSKLLADVKAAIHIANGPILNAIFQMAEDKKTLQMLETLETTSGVKVVSPYGGDVAEFQSVLDGETTLGEIKRLKTKIDHLQDEIDEFNATTEVDLREEAVNLT